MVIGKTQSLFDISYFWLFSGSIFALITPTVITYTGPTRFRYYQFFVEHTAGYVAVFYMIFVHKMRPTFRSMVKSYVALLAVISLMRRGSVIVSFTLGAIFFKERNIRSKALALCVLLVGLYLLLHGSLVG